MAARKRKSPERRGARRKASLASRGAVALGGLCVNGLGALGTMIARHPSIAGGTTVFIVVFSFVAANALWYQRGEHPSPIFRTRDPQSPETLTGRKFYKLPGEQAGNVTTFKIERSDDEAAVTGTATVPAAAAVQPSPLVMDVQKELAHRGLYNGAADGVIGPRTSAAILFFEETIGMTQTGEATAELLAALRTDGKGPSTIPADRPPEDLHSPAAAVDPVAAAILEAERPVKTATTRKAEVTGKVASNDLVMQIQKGLSNIAYANVGIDGVAGEQTRAAIRHFQKHYRLPETGEPDQAVLKKLREIGAL